MLAACTAEVKCLCLLNSLMLNADRSESVFVETVPQLRLLDVDSVTVAGTQLPVSDDLHEVARCRAVDNHLTFDKYTTAVAKACT
jgi:hypothetical protein